MGKVAVVTDSMAYLEPGVAEELGITVVPFNVQVGDRVLEDGTEMDREDFFQHVEKRTPTLRLLPPTVEQFQEAYARVHKVTDEVLSVHVSGRLSRTLRNARRGTESLLGRCEVAMMDSMTTSVGLGILAKAAAETAQQGATLEEVVRLVRGMVPHIYLVLYSNDLDYLERCDHLHRSQAILGSILGIKPILYVEDGEIMALEKVRSYERAVDKLFEFVAEFSDVEQVAILQRHTTPTAEARLLLGRLQPVFPKIGFPIVQYEPLLASHIGPSALGVVVHESVY
jgi:DegV family protein with EDD domain